MLRSEVRATRFPSSPPPSIASTNGHALEAQQGCCPRAGPGVLLSLLAHLGRRRDGLSIPKKEAGGCRGGWGLRCRSMQRAWPSTWHRWSDQGCPLQAMACELSSKLHVASAGAACGSSSCAAAAREGGEAPESMQCSSAECSPALTPKGAAPFLTPSSKLSASSATLASALRPRLPQLGELAPTSPSDPQLEGIDLRKQTLLRLLLRSEVGKAGGSGGEDVEMAAAAAAGPAAGPAGGAAAAASPPGPPDSLASGAVQPADGAASPCVMEESPGPPPRTARLPAAGAGPEAAGGSAFLMGRAGLQFDPT